MMLLVTKMLVYLAAALLAGVGAGWLLRARTTAASEQQPDAAELIEQQEHINALERALEARDEELATLQDSARGDEKLRGELSAKTHRVSELEELVRSLRHEVDGLQSDGTDDLVAALHSEIAKLRDALNHAEAQGGANPEQERMIKELEARLLRKAGELDRLERALSREERKVRELERERDLQNKSLHVLNQQLELERDRRPRTATG